MTFRNYWAVWSSGHLIQLLTFLNFLLHLQYLERYFSLYGLFFFFFMTTFNSLLICGLIFCMMVLFVPFFHGSFCTRNIACFGAPICTFFSVSFWWSFTFATIILSFIFCFALSKLLRLSSLCFFLDIWILMLQFMHFVVTIALLGNQ